MSFFAEKDLELFYKKVESLNGLSSNNIDIYTQKLSEYAQNYSMTISHDESERIVAHLIDMLFKNKVFNLTSITNLDRALVLHSLDSLLFYPSIQNGLGSPTDSISLLDMGTGGGFPGIPLSCVLSSRTTLLDSVHKKINACQEFVEDLYLDSSVKCTHSRIEDYGRLSQSGNKYDVVVARALSSLSTLLEYASPFLKMSGILVVSKGTPSLDEMNLADKTAEICGFVYESIRQFDLPNNEGHRTLLTYRKVQKSAVKLPRKNGEAKRHPLI